MHEFQLKCHWTLFPRVQLTVLQHLFRECFGSDQATGHYQYAPIATASAIAIAAATIAATDTAIATFIFLLAITLRPYNWNTIFIPPRAMTGQILKSYAL